MEPPPGGNQFVLRGKHLLAAEGLGAAPLSPEGTKLPGEAGVDSYELVFRALQRLLLVEEPFREGLQGGRGRGGCRFGADRLQRPPDQEEPSAQDGRR